MSRRPGRGRRDLDVSPRLVADVRDETPVSSATGAARLELVLSSIAVAVVQQSGDGTVLWASPSLERVLGFRSDQVTGRTFPIGMIDPRTPHTQVADPRTGSAASLGSSLGSAPDSAPDSALWAAPVTHQDGSLRWVETSVRRVRDAHGQLEYVVSTLRETTTEVSAAAEADSLRGRLRALWSQHLEPLLFLEPMTDAKGAPDLVVADANTGSARLLGTTREQLIGTCLGELADPWSQVLLPACLRASEDGRSSVQELRIPDAARPLWLALGVVPVPGGLHVSLRETTSHHSTAERLAASENRFQVLAENASDVVLTLNDRHEVTWVAATVIGSLGWSPADLLARTLGWLTHPQDQALLTGLPGAPDSATRGAALRVERLRLRTPAGEYRIFSGRLRRLPGGQESLVCLIDVTESVHSDEGHQALLQAMIDPHLVVRARSDAAGERPTLVVADANDSASRAMGVRRGQLIGLEVRDETALGRTVLAALLQCFESGEPVALDNVAYQFRADVPARYYDLRVVRVGESLSVSWRDVTSRHEDALALGRSVAAFRLLAENASDVVFQTDLAGRINWVSPSAGGLLGWSPEQAEGTLLSQRIHPDDITQLDLAAAGLDSGQPCSFEARFVGPDGYRWLSVTLRPLMDELGQVVGRVAGCRDVTDARRAREELEFLARHDPMTKLLNRAGAQAGLAAVLLSERAANTLVGVLVADLDALKLINDRHGHLAGDAALMETARRIRASVRRVDLVARMGGDEFLVVLPELRSPGDAHTIATKIRAAMAEPLAWNGDPIQLSLSIGIATVEPGEEPLAAIARADGDMYRNKARPRIPGRTARHGQRPPGAALAPG